MNDANLKGRYWPTETSQEIGVPAPADGELLIVARQGDLYGTVRVPRSDADRRPDVALTRALLVIDAAISEVRASERGDGSERDD